MGVVFPVESHWPRGGLFCKAKHQVGVFEKSRGWGSYIISTLKKSRMPKEKVVGKSNSAYFPTTGDTWEHTGFGRLTGESHTETIYSIVGKKKKKKSLTSRENQEPRSSSASWVLCLCVCVSQSGKRGYSLVAFDV